MNKSILVVFIIVLFAVIVQPIFAQIKPGLYDGDAFQGEYIFADYLDWLKTYTRDGGNYTIVIGKNETVNNVVLDYNKKQVTVTLKPSVGERTITFDGANPYSTLSLFVIKTGVTFVLEEGIVIKGLQSGNPTLVDVEGGNFIMNGGAVRDSIAAYVYGGSGVLINGGTFTMNGGVISGNRARSSDTHFKGGGVYILTELLL